MKTPGFIKKGRRMVFVVEPWHTFLVVPVWQEFLFRYIPFKLFFEAGFGFWTVGLLSSVVFSLIHWYFGKWFTLYTFLGGFLAWVFVVNFGLLSAIGLHAAANIIDLGTGFRHKFNDHDWGCGRR